MASRGKKFEQQFRCDQSTYVTDSFCYRLYDVTSGFKGIAGVADFINYKKPYIYLIDCKSHEGNTISFGDFSQYDRMLEYKDIPGVTAGTVVQFINHDKVVQIPIDTQHKLKTEDKKSFNIKMLDNPDYPCFEIPSKKKRVFLETDYSALIEQCENNAKS